MFKKLLFLFIICSLFSCKKESNSVEAILLENLKESSKHYEEECESITMKIQNRHDDYGFKSDKFNSLKLINSRLKNLFAIIETGNKTKSEKIAEQEKTCLEINKLKSEFKINAVKKSKFENLNNESTLYLIKYQLYKIQLKNLNQYPLLSLYPRVCGVSYPEANLILIEKLQKSTVADFKKEFCNCQ